MWWDNFDSVVSVIQSQVMISIRETKICLTKSKMCKGMRQQKWSLGVPIEWLTWPATY